MQGNLAYAKELTACGDLSKLHASLSRLLEERPPGASRMHAWGQVFRECTPALLIMARACGVGPGTAEDVVQDVWLEVLRRLCEWVRPNRLLDFGPWVCRVVHSKAVDAYRRAVRHRADSLGAAVADGREPVDPRPGPALAVERRAEWLHLRAALEKLGQQAGEINARVLELRFLEGQTAAQVGLALGLSEKSVRKRQRQAFAKLRSILKPYGSEG